jgi:hypothetical protein
MISASNIQLSDFFQLAAIRKKTGSGSLLEFALSG